jgi:sodium transport system ATP-binding protein
LLSTDTPLILADSLTRRFDDLLAVDRVSFSVQAGEVVGLLGPNGAGKTTTLRILATLLAPDSGAASIAQHDVSCEPLRARAALGYQTGDTGLYDRLTPREFLRYFGELHGLHGARLRARIDAMTARFALEPFADRLCKTLSTGQRQRVNLARALLHDPPVIILDEPTAGLDIISSRVVLQAISDSRADGRAVLFSTHILSEVELMCDRVLVLHRGGLVAQGTIASLCALTQKPTFLQAFLSLIDAADASSEVAPNASSHAATDASHAAPDAPSAGPLR